VVFFSPLGEFGDSTLELSHDRFVSFPIHHHSLVTLSSTLCSLVTEKRRKMNNQHSPLRTQPYKHGIFVITNREMCSLGYTFSSASITF
jgi:hypothetical protein